MGSALVSDRAADVRDDAEVRHGRSVIFDLATLRGFIEQKGEHLYAGGCPLDGKPARRDPACPVCRVLVAAEKALAAKAPPLEVAPPPVSATIPSPAPTEPSSDGKAFYKAGDLARFCDVDLKTIHNWVGRGYLAAFRSPGRHLRFKPADVRAFIQKYGYAVPAELEGTP